MNEQFENDKEKKNFDLEERTSVFAENIIRFTKNIPQNPITLPIINQMVKAGTSVGANYREADDAESRADFKHKISICKKEARESSYWLRIIKTATGGSSLAEEADKLKQEAIELNLIFNAIVRSTKKVSSS